jgi:hypothetical protein
MSLEIELARLKANPTGAWLQGPKITAEHVKRGTGTIQHITADEFFGRTGKAGAMAGGQMAAAPQGAHVMMFGKHRGKNFTDVKQSDPSYWSWCCREVAGFAAKAKKAGLHD